MTANSARANDRPSRECLNNRHGWGPRDKDMDQNNRAAIKAWVDKRTKDQLRILAAELIEVLDEDERVFLSSDEDGAELCWTGSGEPVDGGSR